MRRGCWDIKERTKAMDEDGVHAQLCLEGLDSRRCAGAPGRQIPLALVPYCRARKIAETNARRVYNFPR